MRETDILTQCVKLSLKASPEIMGRPKGGSPALGVGVAREVFLENI